MGPNAPGCTSEHLLVGVGRLDLFLWAGGCLRCWELSDGILLGNFLLCLRRTCA